MHCHADLVVKAPSSITAHYGTDIRSHRNLNNSAWSTWHLHNLDPSTAADVSTSETWLLSSIWEWPSVAWDRPIWSTRSNTSPAWWDYTIMYRSITSPAGLHHHVQVHHQPGWTTPSCSGPSPARLDYTIMFRSITSPVGLHHHVHASPVGLHHHVQVHHQSSGTTPSCSGPSPARWDYTIMYMPAQWGYTIMFRSITSLVGLHHHVQVHHQPGGTTPSCTCQPSGATPSCSGPSPVQWDYTIMFRSITSPVGLHHHVQVHHQPGGTTPSCSGPSPAWWDYTIMCWSITSPVGLHYHVQIHCCPVNRGMRCTTIMH